MHAINASLHQSLVLVSDLRTIEPSDYRAATISLIRYAHDSNALFPPCFTLKYSVHCCWIVNYFMHLMLQVIQWANFVIDASLVRVKAHIESRKTLQ